MRYELIGAIGAFIETAGVATILIGMIIATAVFAVGWLTETDTKRTYTEYRVNLGRAIMLGLDFLIAGDIIGSITVAPTFTSVGILGIIIVIRTFLSVELEHRVDGAFPWTRKKK